MKIIPLADNSGVWLALSPDEDSQAWAGINTSQLIGMHKDMVRRRVWINNAYISW